MWEFIAKFYNYAGAETSRKIDIDMCCVINIDESERVNAWKLAIARAFYLCEHDKELEGYTLDGIEFLSN